MPATKHTARKRFGQNFLTDARIVDRIIATIAPKKNDNLLEIGPGKGAMTLPLLEELNQLHVIEIDTDLIALLQSFGFNYPKDPSKTTRLIGMVWKSSDT